jgi:NAD(P)-dependent dehydrogenase (short-subunit alcohol dehydrogenase family)
MKTVLLVGGTGSLGILIGRELLKRGARLRLLVRPGSRSKVPADLAQAAEIVEDEQAAFQGVSSVVSAVQGGPETIVDAQVRFLRAARQAGARRFIASDYSLNLFTVPEGDNVASDVRREFARRAEGERGDVEVVHVMNGAFLDRRVLFGFLGAVNLQKREAYRWGDGHEEMQFTTYDDTAAYTAAAALDERRVPDQLFVAEDSLTFDRLVKEIEAGLGAPITVRSLGSFSDLDGEIAKRYAAAPANVPAWLPLMYWRAMLSGSGTLGPLMNDRYPDIRPTGVREYVSRYLAEGLGQVPT